LENNGHETKHDVRHAVDAGADAYLASWYAENAVERL
jgi:hypothetical protein